MTVGKTYEYKFRNGKYNTWDSAGWEDGLCVCYVLAPGPPFKAKSALSPIPLMHAIKLVTIFTYTLVYLQTRTIGSANLHINLEM